MDKLKAMANFVRIVDNGSLSAAADASGQSVASVVRSLAALERHLGAPAQPQHPAHGPHR